MKTWTYGEMNAKVKMDLDLEDETFIAPDEMVGYYNEALNEAQSEIIELHQDYMLTKYFLPLTVGQGRYELPWNIYANKIRGVYYNNGAQIYEIQKYRRKGMFEDILVTDQYVTGTEWYKYLLVNDSPGQTMLELHPVSRDQAVLTQSGLFVPGILWYIRNCARVPVTGEFCNPEIIATNQVNIANDTIQTYAGGFSLGVTQQGLPGAYPGSIALVTGDKVQVVPGPGGTLPSPLVRGVNYFAIQTGNGLIKLATTKTNALNGVAIDLTTVGTVYFTLQVAATTAIINATLIDIPEFATFVMQWVKCRCLGKEGDPRLIEEAKLLAQQKQQMIDTLTQSVDDDNDTIQADFSFYQDLS